MEKYEVIDTLYESVILSGDRPGGPNSNNPYACLL